MDLLSLKKASEISKIPDRTIREWINENLIKKYENERGITCIDKRELLSFIPTVITLFNHKGGCGKTTSTVLLADYFEKKEKKVLLVDFDQQSNLSQTYFEYNDLKKSPTLYDFFEHKTALNKIIKPYGKFIDVLPSDIRLASKDIYDIDTLDVLRKDFFSIFKKYQVIIIDCPPALNSFSKFGLMLANYIFIPVIPEPYNFDGFSEVLNTIKRMEKYIDDFIDFKVIISHHEQRIIKIQESYVDNIREVAKNKVAKITVPNFVGIKERPISGKNIYDMYKGDKAMQRIELLMKELDVFIYDERGEKE